MTNVILLTAMLFFHIIDDYYLQGILASMKQKSWWITNYPNETGEYGLYRNDYIVALVEYAFSWTVMIHIPLLIYGYFIGFNLHFIVIITLFCVNWAIHAVVDDLKANRHMINLVQDQLIHVVQIFIVFFIYVVFGK